MFRIKDRFQRLNTLAHPFRLIGQLQQSLLFILGLMPPSAERLL